MFTDYVKIFETDETLKHRMGELLSLYSNK